jgi:hypothetical protein
MHCKWFESCQRQHVQCDWLNPGARSCQVAGQWQVRQQCSVSRQGRHTLCDWYMHAGLKPLGPQLSLNQAVAGAAAVQSCAPDVDGL